MALALRGIPALSIPSAGGGSGGTRQLPSVACLPRKCRRNPCIHCSASGDSPADESWTSHSKGDAYAGWSFLDNGGSNKKNKKLSGILKVGAGIAVAVGFALVSHAASKRVLVVAPTVAVYHQTTSETAACVDDSEKVAQVTEHEKQVEEKQVEEEQVAEEQVESLAAEDDAEQETTTATQQPDTAPPGQESSPDEPLDEDVTSSAYTTGAASTLGQEDAHSGEELVQTLEDSTISQQVDEDTAELTSRVVSDVLESSSVETKPDQDAELPQISDAELLTSTSVPVHFDDYPVADEVLHSPADNSFTLASVDFESDVTDTTPADAVEEIDVSLSVDMATQSQQEPSPGVGASPVGNADDLIAPEADVKIASTTTSVVPPSSESEFWHFTSVGIPAPSTPFAMISGRILVPPVVDQTQEQAVSALQSLKVVEPGVEAGHICTRREYARWLVAANRTLARSSAAKILPAMCIERATELAFSDVSPEDPDFPFIQGLAEAGLIASKLSSSTTDGEVMEFCPDSPLSRQDLVSWKVALDHHSLRDVDHDELLEKTGFIDLEQVHKDAWPSIAADVSSGDRSIIASAFGYTRRFQPQKPVTKGQAAIALLSGDASEQALEELDRLEAERLAVKAVAAEIAIEARMQKESNEVFREELEVEKQMTAAAERLAQSLKEELDNLKAETDNEKTTLMKEKASVEAVRDSVTETRVQLDTMMQEVSTERIKVVFERERLDKLLAEIEEERNTMAKLKSELEVETKALALARAWAEDEAKKARAHAKILKEARKRWEAQGIEVHVDKELDDANIPVPTWQFNDDKVDLADNSEKKAPVLKIIARADELKNNTAAVIREALKLSGEKLSAVQQAVVASLQEILAKAEEVQRNTFFIVTTRAAEVRKAASTKAGEMQQAAASMASGLSSLVSENTHKLANGCRGSAEKLAQIFKPS